MKDLRHILPNKKPDLLSRSSHRLTYESKAEFIPFTFGRSMLQDGMNSVLPQH